MRARSARRAAVATVIALGAGSARAVLAALAALTTSAALAALAGLVALAALAEIGAPAAPAAAAPQSGGASAPGGAAVAAVPSAPSASSPSSAPRADELRGRIELLAKDGKSPARGSDASHAVIYFEPAVPSGAMRPPETPFQMVTRQKEFVPRILAVPRGSRVAFPNEDPILHNVFSVSGGNRFDLGFNRRGAGKEKRFDEPGLVRVYCNVHQNMVAYILVLETPYYTAPAADGSFALHGLPKGPGRLSVWHEQAEIWAAQVTVPAAAPLAPRLAVIRQLLPAHLNKLGESYTRTGRDRYQ